MDYGTPRGNIHSQEQTFILPESVRIFLPSTWAKLDISTSFVYRQMYPEAGVNGGTSTALEQSNAVLEREKFTSACDHIMIPFQGEHFACGSGSLINICLKGNNTHFDNAYNLSIDDNNNSFSALTAAIWCVDARNKSNSSFTRAVNIPSLSEGQKTILTALLTADSHRKASNAQELLYLVLPVDICTLLSAECSAHLHSFEAVLVNRFWRFEDGTPSKFILWVRPCDTSAGPSPSINVAEYSFLRDISLKRSTPNPSMPDRGTFRNQGTLSDGIPFIVYRLLLYCDEFQKSSGPYREGSACGCYFVPMSLPPEARRSTSAVRIISLAPPGVSTTDVLHYIADDLVSATVYGIDGKTPRGDRVKIFIDIMGFIGDYPAAAGAVDVVGHTGRAVTFAPSEDFMRMKQAGHDMGKPQLCMPGTSRF